MTKICALVGNPVSHSLSPMMHTSGYRAIGRESDFLFTAISIQECELERLVRGAEVMGFSGLAVTHPFKQRVIPSLSKLDSYASEIGAVNTITFEDRHAIGRNTDWLGVLEPLRERGDLTGKRAAIIGSGGAACSAAFAFRKLELDFTIYARNSRDSHRLAERFTAKSRSLDKISDLTDVDIIFHATPVGMEDIRMSLVPASSFRPGQVVFESIYSPAETRLVQDARDAGADVITGDQMLLAQAYAQFEYFTGHQAPKEAMATALREGLMERGAK